VTITSAHLKATDSGAPDNSLVYTVTSAPANGQLELSTKPGTAITSFTQADIAAGTVQYVHNGSETTSDSFTFSVSDSGAILAGNTFNINVSPVPPVVTTNTGATVGEGAVKTITTAQLNATDQGASASSLLYSVSAAPAYGYLQLSTNPGSAITSFTQADLAAGHVQYVHNGTDNYSDSFTFRVSDGTSSSSPATFSISVTPTDDPPVLTTNTGTTAHILSGPTIIATAQLNATDPDTSASNITFTVTGGLAHGFLDLSTAPTVHITSFTEADLQAGRVQYTHQGASFAADSFTFTVKDLTTTLAPATFNINVTL
jgi:hypothetical protein